MTELLEVRVVCNDDAGVFAGCVRHLYMTGVLSLVAVSEARPPRLAFVEFDGRVRLMRISGRIFPVRAFQNYVGNERTAALGMEPCVVAELLNYLRNRGFALDGGNQMASEGWESQGRFTADSLRRSM